MSDSKKIKLIKTIFLSIILMGTFTKSVSFAEDEVIEKSEEELIQDQKNKELEHVARNDNTNLNYYPKLQIGSPNLFTGATTLKANEVFARLGLITFISQGSFNASGVSGDDANVYSYLSPTVNIGWGILDNLFFSATVPYKFYFGKENGLSDPWMNLKYRIITEPFILSIQADGKLPLGNTQKVPPFGDGQADAGLMLLATKPIDNIFIQLGGGYKYRFPGSVLKNNALTTLKYADQINYIADVGYSFTDYGITADIFGYGYIPIGSENLSANYISLGANAVYKYNNLDFNLGVSKSILGYNINNGFSINAGASYKLSFTYPRIFNLLLLSKIDPEDLDKKKDLTDVTKGRDLYINSCAKCHVMVNPDVYTYKEWEPIVNRYKEQKIISKSEESAILDFLNKYTEKE